jgi:hypothetical protein
MRRFALFAAVAGVTALTGCSTLIEGRPQPVADPVAEIETLKPQFDVAAMQKCMLAPDSGCRNRIVGARMFAADLRFVEFEQALFREGRSGSFVSSVAAIALSAGATLSSGGTAQALSASNTLLLGTREAMSKDLLAERTTLALHSAMRARRSEVALRLRRGLTQTIEQYPFEMALVDLNEYVHAGTLLGAVVGVNETVAQSAKTADQALENAIRVDFKQRGTLAGSIERELCGDTGCTTSAQIEAAVKRVEGCGSPPLKGSEALNLVTAGANVTDARRAEVLACLLKNK